MNKIPLKRLSFLCSFFVAVFLLICSCTRNKETSAGPTASDDNVLFPVDEQTLENANRDAVRKENIQIGDFIERYGWNNMKESGTGLRYWIYSSVDDKATKVEKGSMVLLDYSIVFLNGDTVYSSNRDGVKEFVIGRSNEISGLEEGLMLMHKGDKAKLIVPSFLAYGITGDFNKISIKNTLVYDVYVLDVLNY
ncbi:MAG: FKBP-type peptidyl-prolyl cis-trans isomerase [Bacteroidales bacterium]|nr:FKBP-type peptidyl-prolyl cis-trans isomerase [Bacteroidales bacterium]